MPRVSWDSQADWDRWYQSSAGDSYGRTFATEQNPTHPAFGTLNRFEQRFAVLTGLGVTATDRVLVAGCGFGFLMEVAVGHGFPWWGGIDSSSHITSNRGVEADDTTLWIADDFGRISGLAGASRNLQKDLGIPGPQRSARWDWIITEGLLESFEDAELADVFAACAWGLEGPDQSQIVHFVSEPPFNYGPGDPTFNEKTLAQWKAMAPTHTWVLDYAPWTIL